MHYYPEKLCHQHQTIRLIVSKKKYPKFQCTLVHLLEIQWLPLPLVLYLTCNPSRVPSLCASYHNSVFLMPEYKPSFRGLKREEKDVKIWSEDSVSSLKVCKNFDELCDTVYFLFEWTLLSHQKRLVFKLWRPSRAGTDIPAGLYTECAALLTDSCWR